jgi:AcrR family transcriptional regulator
MARPVERMEPIPAERRPGEGLPVAEGSRRRRLTGPQRQRSILYAAAEVFARRGYDGARIEEIAEEANVSKALIYEHFKGKRELYGHIRTQGATESMQRWLAAAEAADGADSKTLLEAALNAFFDFVAEQPLVWRVVEQEVSDPDMIAMDQSVQQRSEHAIAALLAADEDMAGLGFDADQLELLAVMMNGAAVRAANWWLANPALDRDQVVGSVLQFMWLGLDRIRLGEQLEQNRTTRAGGDV